MDASQVTELLNRWRAGDASAGEQAMNLLYPVLRESAAAQLRRAPFNVTLSAAELVSEAFVRIVESDAGTWENRRHFFALAARVMRFLIVDLARRRSAEKRGGQIEVVPLDTFDVDSAVALDVSWDWLGLDSILIEFERLYPQCSKVARMKRSGIRDKINRWCIIDARGFREGHSSSQWRFGIAVQKRLPNTSIS